MKDADCGQKVCMKEERKVHLEEGWRSI